MQQAPGFFQDIGCLALGYDHDTIAIHYEDVTGSNCHAGTLNGDVHLSVAGDGGDVGHKSFANHRELEFSDLLDVAAGSINHGGDS